MSKRARVWRFDGVAAPADLYLADEELPELGPGQVLVRMHTLGLNRSDLMFLAGRYLQPPGPRSGIGQEACGVIVAAGPPDPNDPPVVPLALNPGQRVALLVGRIDFAGTGAFRTAGVFPASALLPVPDELSDDQAASFWLGGLTAAGALHVAGVGRDTGAPRSVLVTAASSGVGVLVMMIARAWGHRVIAATTSPSKVYELSKLAGDVIVARSGTELSTQVLEATSGRGADVVIDPVGLALADSLPGCVAQDGQIVHYGMLDGDQAALDLRSLILKDITVQGFTVHRLLRSGAATDLVEELIRLAREEDLRPLVAARHQFDALPAALEALSQNRHLGKIVVGVDGTDQTETDTC